METLPVSRSQSPTARSAPPAAARPVILRSEELFADGQEIWIEHAGEMYRLRITSRGKLLLTK